MGPPSRCGEVVDGRLGPARDVVRVCFWGLDANMMRHQIPILGSEGSVFRESKPPPIRLSGSHGPLPPPNVVTSLTSPVCSLLGASETAHDSSPLSIFDHGASEDPSNPSDHWRGAE
jgi:hypothetical protein